MATQKYSTGFGGALAQLGQALLPNTAQRQMINLRAQGLQSRNLAHALTAQEKRFDLDHKKGAMKELQDELQADPNNFGLANALMATRLGDSSYAKNRYLGMGEKRLQDSLANFRNQNVTVDLPGPDGITQKVSLADIIASGGNISQAGSVSQARSAIGENESTTNKNKALEAGYRLDNKATEALQEVFKNGLDWEDSYGVKHKIPAGAITKISDLTDLGIDQATVKKIIQQTATSKSTEDINKQKLEFDQALFPNQYALGRQKLLKARLDTRTSKYKAEKNKIEMWLAKKTKNLELSKAESEEKIKKYESYIKRMEATGKVSNFQFLGNGQAVALQQDAMTGGQKVISIDMNGNPKIVRDWKKVQRIDPNTKKPVEVLVSPSLKQEIILKQDEKGDVTFGVSDFKEKGELKVGDKFVKSVNLQESDIRQMKDVVTTAKAMIKILNENPTVAGGLGLMQRWREVFKSAKGRTDIPATNFNTALRYLRFQATPMLLSEKKITDEEREQVKGALGGEKLFDLAGKTKGGLQFLVTLLEARANGEEIKASDILSIIEGGKGTNPGIIPSAQYDFQQRQYPLVQGMFQNNNAPKEWDAIRPQIDEALGAYGNSLRFSKKHGAFFVVDKNGKARPVLVNGQPLQIPQGNK